MPKRSTEKPVWTTAPNNCQFTGVNGFLGAIRKKLRPKFKHLHATVLTSVNGKNKITAMMNELRGTPGDKTFCDALLKANLITRFGGDLKRNKSTVAKGKKHPNAIDFKMGEQQDGAANELRGATVRAPKPEPEKPPEEPWAPPDDLMIQPDWRITDMRIFQLIDAAKANKGPLAESANPRKATSSTSHGRVATFMVDYFAALVTAYDEQFPEVS
tara:strand:- start:164 stop:808 length:645 start_codon:yes stop_codon:yes gene_type:complete